MKKLIILLMVTILVFTGCGKTPVVDEGDSPTGTNLEIIPKTTDNGVYKLAFKETVSIEKLKELDGKQVSINGYMATSSPADGSFIFLMNLPYQSCPFCVPNTSQLANTMEVYPKKDATFEYTTQAITTTGTLKVAEDNKPFTDNYGYEFYFKIEDAEYNIMTEADMTDSLKGWQKIADSGIIQDLYTLYDFVWFNLDWFDYYQESFTDLDGNTIPGYYMYPGDYTSYLQEGYADCIKETYYDDLINKIKGLNDESLNNLIPNIEKCQKLIDKANISFTNEEWTTETKYWEIIGCEETKYTMTNFSEWETEYNALWDEFILFINSYEL